MWQVEILPILAGGGGAGGVLDLFSTTADKSCLFTYPCSNELHSHLQAAELIVCQMTLSNEKRRVSKLVSV